MRARRSDRRRRRRRRRALRGALAAADEARRAPAREGAGRSLEQLARAGRRRRGGRRGRRARRSTPRTRSAPGAASAATSAVARADRGGARAHRRPASSSASSSTTTSAARAATRVAASSTPAAPRPGKAIAAVLAERVREHPRITVVEDERVVALWEADGRCVGVVTDRRAIAARATLLATGGYAALWERTTNPPGAVGEGLAARLPRRRRARRPRVRPVPPDRARSTTASCSPRRCAARARCSSTTTASASPTSSRRATSSRARSPRAARRGSTCARSSASRFPGLMATLERAGYDPARRADPGLAGRALHGRRHRHRPRRRAPRVPGPLRRRRVRRAPASTARTGSRRTRCSSASSSAAAPALAALAEPRVSATSGRQPPCTSPSRRSRPSSATRSGEDAGVIRSAEGLERLRDVAALLPRLVAESALARAREPRRPLPLRLPDRGRRPSRGHVVLRRGRRAACSSDGADAPRTSTASSRAALAEDVGSGDLTTDGVVPADARCRAELLLEEPGVVCGVAAARGRLRRRSTRPSASRRSLDEGTASRTSRPCVARDRGPGARGPHRRAHRAQPVRPALRDRDAHAPLRRRSSRARARRSSTRARRRPGLRALEKYAVRCGGGTNHRAGLYDAILVKENHLRVAGGITRGGRARSARNGLPIEVEAETLDEVREALDAGVDRILLDNMTPERGARGRRARRRPRRSSRPPAASRSPPSAPTPRPASTSSPSAR